MDSSAPSGDNGSLPNDEAKENLNQVINSTEKTLEILHQLQLDVSSFKEGSQLSLLQSMNDLVMEFDKMSKLAKRSSIEVPMEVVNMIDDGKNPDEFTRNVFNALVEKNQVNKGKVVATKSFHGHLLQELKQAYPDYEVE